MTGGHDMGGQALRQAFRWPLRWAFCQTIRWPFRPAFCPPPRWILVLAVLTGWVGARPEAGSAQVLTGVELPVVEHELANGMRWLVLPRAGPPTVSFIVKYGVGAVNEVRGQTGMAHLLEHLLFKGTETLGTRNATAEHALFVLMDALQDSILALEARGDTAAIPEIRERIDSLENEAGAHVLPNEFERVLSTNGARSINATTDWESTTYSVELPANRAQLWFLLESDRMANPVFREFYAERDIVAEERRLRVETNPGGLLFEAHMAAAFTTHPYGQPVVGYMADIQRLRRPDVEAYFRRYYGPSNAVVTVVGDVDPDQILAWAEEYFGDLPASETPAPVLLREPTQTEERRVEVTFDAEPQVRIGWPVVETSHPDAPALTILSWLLTGGRTSRLYRRLVIEDRVATAIYSSTGPGIQFPAIFTIDATPRFPNSTDDVEAAVYAELDSLRRTPPSEREMQRIQNQLEAGEFRRLTSNLGLALQLAGSASAFGDWRTTFSFTDRLAAVRPEDVLRVAQRFFNRERRTVATLVRPESGAGR
ncbi:MAG: insulinase family protein [Gemmatimonadetes bacterium]|nr:insulinase family protein [Gemmatimonadota bacterium]